MKIILVDFEDSFTSNVRSFFEELGHQVNVIHWREFSLQDHADLIVLGPGPGHIHDYQFENRIREYVNLLPRQKWLGICLGHQILGSYLGLNLKQLSIPIHGQTRLFQIPQWSNFNKKVWGFNVEVQMYNSWVLLPESDAQGFDFITDADGWVMAFKHTHYLGFQFHPESVGTSSSEQLFDRDFISPYNRADGPELSP